MTAILPAKRLWRGQLVALAYRRKTATPISIMESQGRGIILWPATSRQTWAATAYLRMVLLGLVGMRFDTDGVRFQPCVPKDVSSVDLRNLRYRRMTIDVTIRGTGTKVKQCFINGQESAGRFVSAQAEGLQKVAILLE